MNTPKKIKEKTEEAKAENRSKSGSNCSISGEEGESKVDEKSLTKEGESNKDEFSIMTESSLQKKGKHDRNSTVSFQRKTCVKTTKPSGFQKKDHITCNNSENMISKAEDFTSDLVPEQIFEKAGIEKFFIDEWKLVIETINSVDKYMSDMQYNNESVTENVNKIMENYFSELNLEGLSTKLKSINKVRSWLELKNSAIDIYLRDAKKFSEQKLQSKNVDNVFSSYEN